DGWKSALSGLHDLVVLQLPYVLWQADVEEAGPEGAGLRLAAEQCVKGLPSTLLQFTSARREVALVINNKDDDHFVLERARLLDHGRIMSRNWSLYDSGHQVEFKMVISRLIPPIARMSPKTEEWLEESEIW
ncbi:hypothetical protein FRB90_002257, partial [Tulasnella sp. 427]